MKRVGIIACQVFEKELAFLLEKNGSIDRVYARPTKENMEFSSMLKKRKLNFIDDIGGLPKGEGTDVLLEILPIGLHVDIDDLIEKRSRSIDALKEHCDKVMMLYGLCGDASKRVFNREDIELIAPRDEGEIVDDCICSVLGRKEYLKQLKNLGSLFFIPGFALHWKDMAGLMGNRDGDMEGMKMMLEYAGYRRTMVIDHGLWEDVDMDLARKASTDVELPMERTDGNMNILMKCFEETIGP
ncbi:MAG TPA: DUF1638 domain-containing protein [Candidatus Methanofastidiosa archaeon]|nr:DUF1638 domain-containing protein [Candidatus Methanofastidiosa archaeon]